MVKLNLGKDFDDLIKSIEGAIDKVDAAAERCIKENADIMDAELRDKLAACDGDFEDGEPGAIYALSRRMPPPKIEKNFGVYTARVGFVKGAYDPNNISDGYKAVFLNYGTPKRTTDKGQIKAMKFIDKAKKAAKPKIKERQEEVVNEVVKGIKK